MVIKLFSTIQPISERNGKEAKPFSETLATLVKRSQIPNDSELVDVRDLNALKFKLDGISLTPDVDDPELSIFFFDDNDNETQAYLSQKQGDDEFRSRSLLVALSRGRCGNFKDKEQYIAELDEKTYIPVTYDRSQGAKASKSLLDFLNAVVKVKVNKDTTVNIEEDEATTKKYRRRIGDSPSASDDEIDFPFSHDPDGRKSEALKEALEQIELDKQRIESLRKLSEQRKAEQAKLDQEEAERVSAARQEEKELEGLVSEKLRELKRVQRDIDRKHAVVKSSEAAFAEERSVIDQERELLESQRRLIEAGLAQIKAGQLGEETGEQVSDKERKEFDRVCKENQALAEELEQRKLDLEQGERQLAEEKRTVARVAEGLKKSRDAEDLRKSRDQLEVEQLRVEIDSDKVALVREREEFEQARAAFVKEQEDYLSSKDELASELALLKKKRQELETRERRLESKGQKQDERSESKKQADQKTKRELADAKKALTAREREVAKQAESLDAREKELQAAEQNLAEQRASLEQSEEQSRTELAELKADDEAEQQAAWAEIEAAKRELKRSKGKLETEQRRFNQRKTKQEGSISQTRVDLRKRRQNLSQKELNLKKGQKQLDADRTSVKQESAANQQKAKDLDAQERAQNKERTRLEKVREALEKKEAKLEKRLAGLEATETEEEINLKKCCEIIDQNWDFIRDNVRVVRRKVNGKMKYCFSRVRRYKDWGLIPGDNGLVTQFPSQDFIMSILGKGAISSGVELEAVWGAMGLDVANEKEEIQMFREILLENIEHIKSKLNIKEIRVGREKRYLFTFAPIRDWCEVPGYGLLAKFPSRKLIEKFTGNSSVQAGILDLEDMKKVFNGLGLKAASDDEEKAYLKSIIEDNWEHISQSTKVLRGSFNREMKYCYDLCRVRGWGDVPGYTQVAYFPNKKYLHDKALGKLTAKTPDELKAVWEYLGMKTATNEEALEILVPKSRRKEIVAAIKSNWDEISKNTGVVRTRRNGKEHYDFSKCKSARHWGEIPSIGLVTQSPMREYNQRLIGSIACKNGDDLKIIWGSLGLTV